MTAVKLKSAFLFFAYVLALGGASYRVAFAQQPSARPGIRHFQPTRTPRLTLASGYGYTRTTRPSQMLGSAWAKPCNAKGCAISNPDSLQQKPTVGFMSKELRALDEFANPEKYAGDGKPVLRVLPAMIGPNYGITAKAVF